MMRSGPGISTAYMRGSNSNTRLASKLDGSKVGGIYYRMLNSYIMYKMLISYTMHMVPISYTRHRIPISCIRHKVLISGVRC